MPVLLDTCAIIYIANSLPISAAAHAAIRAASGAGDVIVSPISAWETGMLHAKRRIQFLPDAKSWFQDFVARNAVAVAPMTHEVALDSWTLPDPFHGDPADRVLVATARLVGAPLITRDQKILAYAGLGHLHVIRC